MKSYARAKYLEAAKPWNEQCDIAFPCSMQNEIDQADAIALVNSGCRILVEGRSFAIIPGFSSSIFYNLYSLPGSNMPCTPQAVDVLRKGKVMIAPAKVAGIGGVQCFL